MPTIKENIVTCLNGMRTVVFADGATRQRLIDSAVSVEKQRPRLKIMLDALLDSEFQLDQITYILTVVRNDIWQHRKAITTDPRTGKISLDLTRVSDPDVGKFWALITPQQQEGVLHWAETLIETIEPLALQLGWNKEIKQGLAQWEEEPVAGVTSAMKKAQQKAKVEAVMEADGMQREAAAQAELNTQTDDVMVVSSRQKRVKV
jgi:hypothetical protein